MLSGTLNLNFWRHLVKLLSIPLENYSFKTTKLSSVQSLSRVRLFATPWIAACQASLSTTNSWSLFKLMSIESVMSSNHLILCRPLLLPPSVFPNIRVFSNESSSSHQMAKVLEFQLQHQSFHWIFRTVYLTNLCFSYILQLN